MNIQLIIHDGKMFIKLYTNILGTFCEMCPAGLRHRRTC